MTLHLPSMGPDSFVRKYSNDISGNRFYIDFFSFLALVVNVMSYNGQVRVWVNADANICPSQASADELAEYILEELEELMEFA